MRRRSRRSPWGICVALAMPVAASRADDVPPLKVLPARTEPTAPAVPEGVDYWTTRYEPAAFPLIGGDSDIGFQFGAVGTLTRFEGGVPPYLWNMDFVLAASVKNGPREEAEIAQQSYVWNWDVPALMSGRLRLNPLVAYQRTINEGYFGLGNASGGERPERVAGDRGRYFEFVYAEARARELARIKLDGPWDLTIGPSFRIVDPGVYPGSKLATDASPPEGPPLVDGLRPLALASFATGVVFDSRDNEIFPRRGQFHQASFRHTQGFPLRSEIHYEQASAIFAWFAPVGHDTVLALRAVVDFKLGNIPFYDLSTAGPFITAQMPGGAEGVRGVPIGRYSGPIKAIANVELRTLANPLHIFGGSFRFGGAAFADTGRVWSDYSFSSPLDGKGLGLKYGAGVGGYLLWGQAALFRVDVAYSPDAVVQSPKFPIGVYVEDGTMF